MSLFICFPEFFFFQNIFGCNVFGSPFNKSRNPSHHLNTNLVTFLNNSIDKIIVDVHFISDKKIWSWSPNDYLATRLEENTPFFCLILIFLLASHSHLHWLLSTQYSCSKNHLKFFFVVVIMVVFSVLLTI